MIDLSHRLRSPKQSRSCWQYLARYFIKTFISWLYRLAMAVQNSPISVRYNSIVFCFFVDRLYHISLRDDPRFRCNSVPLFSPAVSSFARRFIILFLYRDKFFAVERNAQDVAHLKYTKIACKVTIAKVREKNVSRRQNK